MNEDQIRQFELIQQIISRMANNSFLVKGWSLTLVAAIFAVAAQGNTWGLVWTALLPAFVFWGLDAFYLRQERLFRHLYDDAIISQSVSFSMNTRRYEYQELYWDVARRRAIWPLHIVILITIVIVGGLKSSMFSVNRITEKHPDSQVNKTITSNCPAPVVIVREVPMMTSDMSHNKDDKVMKVYQHTKHCKHSHN
ncbi:hypothetical protein [Fluviicoccus keumensis]|uniref:hypothetical protein n=1 Tax=Fluviicoccus keumensis TaxID=1435465 RepID=UPI00102C778C|nr:hypothetical protein [Fluviicoccus keumensis]